MPDDERSRILAMLEAGRISVEQASVLLDAVAARVGSALVPPAPPAPGRASGPPAGPSVPAAGPRPRPPAQLLRISIDAKEGASDKARVTVNVPLKLARFASRFLPQEARSELEDQGIDLTELLSGLGDEVPDGPLVDIDAGDAAGAKSARIRIEVV